MSCDSRTKRCHTTSQTGTTSSTVRPRATTNKDHHEYWAYRAVDSRQTKKKVMASLRAEGTITTDNAPNVMSVHLWFRSVTHLILDSSHISLLPPVDCGWEILNLQGWHKRLTSWPVGTVDITVVNLGKFSTIL